MSNDLWFLLIYLKLSSKPITSACTFYQPCNIHKIDFDIAPFSGLTILLLTHLTSYLAQGTTALFGSIVQNGYLHSLQFGPL